MVHVPALAAAFLVLVPPAPEYRLPPPEVVEIVDAPPPPTVELSPDGRWMLMLERDAMPSIADVSRRKLRLAGIRIDPAADARYRSRYARGLLLRPTLGGGAVRVPLPSDARLASVNWSHDSRHFVYRVVTDDGSQLWGAHVDGAESPRRLTSRLNTVLTGIVWMPRGDRVVCAVVPEGRGDEPAAPPVPSGPVIQWTAGDTSPLRTYQDLLESPHDEARFEHHGTTQLVEIALADGSRRRIGGPALYLDVEPSPDGRHLLVSRIHRPYSYVMPLWRFPRTIEVRTRRGEPEHLVADVPLGENIPIQGVRTGPRLVRWKAGEPATLIWAEALDGGDPRREVAYRDRWMTSAFPFDDPPRQRLRLEQRARGVTFLADASALITREYDRDRRWVRSLLHDLDDPAAEPRVLEDRSVRDRYGDPGRIIEVPDERGSPVALQHGAWVLRSGRGASPQGLLPFLDRQHLETLETERLWRCRDGAYERVAAVLEAAPRAARFITRHETPESPPNYRLRDLGDGSVIPLTDFPDPAPQLRDVRKELVTYERADGVRLSATLYLPPDYEPGTRLPLLVWAYPIEYNDPYTAGQISSSPWRFTRIRGASHLTLLTQGYAIMDRATMPVIGDPEIMNDTFVEQIVLAGEAAIEKAAAMGVADPDRVGVGGHSYGAFMTANLLAHCDHFRAGIARSGAYNRTLTPFGFQAERRTVWEAPQTYLRISPFFHADEIDEPLLLVHGAIDSNSGTYPMQSRRLFSAIKGNGGTARLVVLPAESHGYRARASVLHVLAEMIDWLDRYVKGAGSGSPAAAGDAG